MQNAVGRDESCRVGLRTVVVFFLLAEAALFCGCAGSAKLSREQVLVEVEDEVQATRMLLLPFRPSSVSEAWLEGRLREAEDLFARGAYLEAAVFLKDVTGAVQYVRAGASHPWNKIYGEGARRLEEQVHSTWRSDPKSRRQLEEQVQLCLRQLVNAPEAVRVRCRRYLAAAGEPGLQQLKVAVLSADPLVRTTAAMAAAEQGDTSVTPLIIDALESSHALLRADAAFHLHYLYGTSFGFRAFENSERRRAAVERWRNWWRDRQAGGLERPQ